MGTTATFLQMTKEGMVIAHAGDSRVYHIRKGSIVFCTYDHSLKNELLKQGRREEAKYAKDNIITRAIQGNSVKQIQLDVSTIKDIQAGDYFLLCSDGVWGAIPDKDLRGILNQAISDEEKMETIRRACELSSNDNYSAYLIRVKEVVEEKTLALDKTWIGNSKTVTTNDKQKNILVEDTKSTPKSKSGVVWGLLGIFLLVLGGWFLYINMGVDGEGLSSTNTIENTSKQQLMDQQANRKTKALPANQPVSNNKSNSSKTVVKKKKKSTSGNNRKDRKILIPPLPTLILTPISIESSEFREWNKK